MTPPLPHLRPPEPPGEPAIRLDVRLGAGKAVSYQMGEEFRIGGAPACNLRLPGTHVPDLVCRINRTGEGLRLRKIDPAFPVLVNGAPVAGIRPTPLHNGDRIAVGPADVTVSVGTNLIRPRFVPITPPPPPANTAILETPHAAQAAEEEPQEPPSLGVAAALAAEREELAQWRARLEEQARELETDRVLWYRRRQEMEAEYQRLRHSAPGVEEAQQELARREQDLTRREQELTRTREELVTLRQSLFDQYQERRNHVAQMQDVVHGAAEALRERQREFEEECARRRQALNQEVQAAVAAEVERLEAEYADRLARAEGEVTRLTAELAAQSQADAAADLAQREEQLRVERAAHAEDLVRLDRLRAALDARRLGLDRRAAEIDERYEQLRRDTLELEENVRLADAEQERLKAEAGRLEKLRTDLEGEADRLARRAAQLEAQQAMLAILRARLDRQQDDARRETDQLAADRVRLADAQRDLETRLREAERLRAELTSARADHEEQQRLATERTALLNATLAEIQQQKEALALEHTRLRDKEAELDARSTEIAEQAAVLKARVAQVMDLQERLEADRAAVREREVTLTEADTARQTFQEQLRRRAEELTIRSRQLDESARRLHEEMADFDRRRAEWQNEQRQTQETFALTHDEWTQRAAELDRRAAELADREESLDRQLARLREVGRSVALGRKELDEYRRQVEAERADLVAFRARTHEELEAIRRGAPELEERVRSAIERLTAGRDVLRGHLAELHAYATQTREELDTLRAELRTESDRLREREQTLEKARSEHRLAVTEFRQQLLDWQARIAELKQVLAQGETRLEARQAESAVTTLELARQAEDLRQERQQVAERRAEVERHLADMREWYRKKLRELAQQKPDRGKVEPDAEPIAGRVGPGAAEPPFPAPPTLLEELDPGDRQLGELLRSLELVDAVTLEALWDEARRQRRPLRRVLLTSGAVTLYQLALIEAGNLDGLMLGRFRVVDRLRATPRETCYRVFDPERAEGAGRGTYLLRHLAEAEMEDAVHPDEFRQRFAAARDVQHPNLAQTLEVLEIHGRPAALQEWLAGVPSTDWPADVATPGLWVKLLTAAAEALAAAHRSGLIHGRLTSESFVFTADGELKVTGFGEPPWLVGGPAPSVEPSTEGDLRALGQVAYGWTLLSQSTPRKRSRKGFPESLLAVVRRLEADAETPMADTAPGVVPYRSAGELAADLARLTALFPCPVDAWEKLVTFAASYGRSGTEPGLRQSA